MVTHKEFMYFTSTVWGSSMNIYAQWTTLKATVDVKLAMTGNWFHTPVTFEFQQSNGFFLPWKSARVSRKTAAVTAHHGFTGKEGSVIKSNTCFCWKKTVTQKKKPIQNGKKRTRLRTVLISRVITFTVKLGQFKWYFLIVSACLRG